MPVGRAVRSAAVHPRCLPRVLVMTEREEANPYASPVAVCESAPATWHFLDHHQGHLFVGLLGLGFGGPCLAGLLGMTLVAMGTASMAAWFTLNCLGRATAGTASTGHGAFLTVSHSWSTMWMNLLI